MFVYLPVVSEGSKPLPASTRAKAGTFAYHDKAASRAQPTPSGVFGWSQPLFDLKFAQSKDHELNGTSDIDW